MEQYGLCTKIFKAKWENREKISDLIHQLHPDKCKTHEDWMSIAPELEKRIDWQSHLEYHLDRAYQVNEPFEPEKVRLTLDDY